MLTLICDRCGVEMNLYQHLTPKVEEIKDDEKRVYWDMSYDYGYDAPFDHDPMEFAAWEWKNGWGHWGKNSIEGHYCKNCKEEYKKYIKDYNEQSIDLESVVKDKELGSVKALKMKAEELKTILNEDFYKYKENFRTYYNQHRKK